MGCTQTKQRAGELLIHFPKVNLVLDPQKMEDAYSMAVNSQIYRGLFRYSPTGAVLNDLAESYIEAKDHKSYKIILKKSEFSDGTPITSKHVQMSFARMFHLGASMAGDIDYIDGANEFKKDKIIQNFGVKAIDPHTVEFRLAKPSAIFLKQLAVADCGILKIADFTDEPNLTEKGGFSGPFKITSPLQNGRVVIEKWRPDPQDSKNPPKKITYFMTDQDPITLADKGETDTLDHDFVPIDKISSLLEKGWGTTPTEISGEIFVVMNPDLIPETVRQLMFASINSVNLANSLSITSYRPAFGLIPFGLPGELSQAEVGSISKPALNPLSKPITIQLDFESNSALEQKIVTFLSTEWAKLNIHVAANPLPKNEKLKKLFGKKSQTIIGKKGMDYPDGFSVLGYFKGNYDSNYFFVNDPAIDASLSDVVQVTNENMRESAYKKLQKTILAKGTLIPLLFGSQASGLWSNKLKFVPAHPLGYHMLPMESLEMRG